MRRPTLRYELIAALALVFTGALLVAVTGVLVLLPRFATSAQATFYLTLLLVVDVAVFAVFGRYLLQRRVVAPLERMIAGIEAIAAGDYGYRLPDTGAVPAEMARLAEAVNAMTERLFSHKVQLADNIRSLEETNQLLTEARDELIRVEKMASVGRLGAGIAHEVGNPLGAILGYLAVLGRKAEPEEGELLAAAEREARRIDRIIHGLLDYARPHESRAKTLQVNQVVSRVVELVKLQGHLSNIQVDTDLEEDMPQIVADAYQLEQVLVNLLLNAVDALAESPEPTLRLQTRVAPVQPRRRLPPRRRDDPPEVDYSHRRRFHDVPKIPGPGVFPAGGQLVEITVRDNGPGIPKDLLREIFEPFVTTKEPGAGTGLGLAVAARLVDGMSGTMKAGNHADGGAVFTIRLPIPADDLPPGRRKADSTSAVPEPEEAAVPGREAGNPSTPSAASAAGGAGGTD